MDAQSPYSPPCWVNPKLQKILLSSKRQDIYSIAKQLWEASGGEECGFIEFEKYLEYISMRMPRDTLREIWFSLSDRDRLFETPKKRLSHLAPVFHRQKKCVHCEEFFAGGGEKDICSGCEHANSLVFSVVLNVLN